MSTMRPRALVHDWDDLTLWLAIIFALGIQAQIVLGQEATIVDAAGASFVVRMGEAVALAPKVVARLEANALRIRNGGDPDRFNTSAWTPQPWYFRSIAVRFPGRRPQMHPFDGSLPGAVDGDWWLVPEGAPRHAHHEAADPAQPWYAPSAAFQMLDGGDTFYMRLTPNDDPYELGPLPESRKAAALAVADVDLPLLQRPLAAANLALYRVDATSLVPSGAPRNHGWFLIPDFFVQRFTSWPRDLCAGWYAFPDHQLPGDGVCNAHYGHDAAWLTAYLLRGDPLSRTVGMALVRQKAATGLFDVDRPYPSCRYAGMWRGEKAGLGRRGSGLGPAPSKEWDAGLLMASALDPGCPLLAQARSVRRTRLLTVSAADIWNGAGGGRLAGLYLRNLRDWFVATGDEAFRTKAASFVAHVWAIQDRETAAWNAANPGNPMRWFPNVYDRTRTAAWEEATLHAQLYWWASTGVGAPRLPQLDAMVDWMITACSGPRGATGEWQVAYQKDVVTGVWLSNTPANCLWWVPLTPTVKARLPQHAVAADRWTDTAFRRIGQTWADVDAGKAPVAPHLLAADGASEGPGAFKMRAYAALALRR